MDPTHKNMKKTKTKMRTRHILVKLPKISDKDNILKAAREQIIYGETKTSCYNSSLENRRISLKYGRGEKKTCLEIFI